jgi:hypothetical protein
MCVMFHVSRCVTSIVALLAMGFVGRNNSIDKLFGVVVPTSPPIDHTFTPPVDPPMDHMDPIICDLCLDTPIHPASHSIFWQEIYMFFGAFAAAYLGAASQQSFPLHESICYIESVEHKKTMDTTIEAINDTINTLENTVKNMADNMLEDSDEECMFEDLLDKQELPHNRA